MGTGYMLEGITGIPYWQGALIAVLVTVIYVVMGGMRAVAWTDTIQGLVMIVVIFAAALYISFTGFGGPVEQMAAVAAKSPRTLQIPGPIGLWTYQYTISFAMLIWFCGPLMPHLWVRYYSPNSEKTVKYMAMLIPIYATIIYVPAVLLGTAGTVLAPGLARADTVVPVVLSKFAPPALSVLVVVGIFAAAMSTADGMLLLVSSVITRDIYQKLIRPQVTQRALTWIGRIMILIVMPIAFIMAINPPGLIFLIVGLLSAVSIQYVLSLIHI